MIKGYTRIPTPPLTGFKTLRFPKEALRRPNGACGKICMYFEEIDNNDGEASRINLYRIAGSEESLNRWIKYLTERGWIEETEENGRKIYSKTERGEKLHQILMDWDIVTALTFELSGKRLKRL